MAAEKSKKPQWTRGQVIIVVCAVLFVAFAISYPLQLDRVCRSLGNSEISVNELSKYSKEGQSASNQTKQQPISPGNIPTDAEINKQTARDQANNSWNNGETWWTRFWCDQTAGDYILALFTFLLVIAGSVQAAFIWAALRESQNASEIARSAAKTSDTHVRAMVELERARIAFNFVQMWLRGEPSTPLTVGVISKEPLVVALSLANVGRTGAYIRAIAVEWYVGTSLADTPVFAHPPSRMNFQYGPEAHLFMPQPKPPIEIEERELKLDATQLSRIKSATDFLWVYGYVEFIDFVGDIYRQGFVGHWEEVATESRVIGRGFRGDGPIQYVQLTKVGHEETT